MTDVLVGPVTTTNPRGSTGASASGLVEVPIVYYVRFLSIFGHPAAISYLQKKQCSLTKFVTKYDYLCKHSYLTTIVHTDHRSLTHFLGSDLHEGIYGHWANKFRRLNISIEYIPGHRNKVADGLSRTLFRTETCEEDEAVRTALKA